MTRLGGVGIDGTGLRSKGYAGPKPSGRQHYAEGPSSWNRHAELARQ